MYFMSRLKLHATSLLLCILKYVFTQNILVSYINRYIKVGENFSNASQPNVQKMYFQRCPRANVKICFVLKQSVCLQPSPEGTCLSHQNWLRENKSMQMNEWKLGHQIAASKRQCGFHYMVTCHEKIVVAHSRESSRHPVWMEMLGFCLRPM